MFPPLIAAVFYAFSDADRTYLPAVIPACRLAYTRSGCRNLLLLQSSILENKTANLNVFNNKGVLNFIMGIMYHETVDQDLTV